MQKRNQTTRLTQTNWILSSTALTTILLLSACGGGSNSGSSDDTDGGETNNSGTLGLIKQETLEIALFEGDSITVNLLEEGCNDSVSTNLTYNGNDTLPADYNYIKSENTLTIDLSETDIDDSSNNTDRFELTCATHVTSEQGNLDVIKQDLDNDALMTANIVLPDELTTNQVFSGMVTLTDANTPEDGVLDDRYTFDIIDTSDESSVFTGTMETSTADTESSRDYDFSVDLASNAIASGNYRFETQAISPVVGGSENAQTDVTITFGFAVDGATVISKPTEDAKTSTTIDSTIGEFSDEDGVQNLTVVLYSDPELTSEIDRNSAGDFTGLTSNTTYYLVTEGEAKNSITDEWELKQSTALTVKTSFF